MKAWVVWIALKIWAWHLSFIYFWKQLWMKRVRPALLGCAKRWINDCQEGDRSVLFWSPSMCSTWARQGRLMEKDTVSSPSSSGRTWKTRQNWCSAHPGRIDVLHWDMCSSLSPAHQLTSSHTPATSWLYVTSSLFYGISTNNYRLEGEDTLKEVGLASSILCLYLCPSVAANGRMPPGEKLFLEVRSSCFSCYPAFKDPSEGFPMIIQTRLAQITVYPCPA